MARVRSVDLASSFLTNLDGACEVLLVRHGEQALTLDMALVDAVDAPLSELGRRQAAAVALRLADLRVDAIYSSTLARARDTGAAIAAAHGCGVIEIDDLREINLWQDLDQHQGLTASLDANELRRIMREGNRTQRWDSYPYSEPRDLFRARVVGAVDAIAAAHVGQRVVVACHGGVINGYLAHCLSSSLDTPCTVHHTSITTVRAMDDMRRVVQVNDHAHVRAFQSELNPMNAL